VSLPTVLPNGKVFDLPCEKPEDLTGFMTIHVVGRGELALEFHVNPESTPLAANDPRINPCDAEQRRR